jgi:predicted component of type VI protein secretion system
VSTSRFIQATKGVNAGCVFALGQRTVLGRSPESHIQVMDPRVSRRHACLVLDEDGHTVLRDLASSNGTFVADAPVVEHRLRSGETFRIGGSEFLFGRVHGDVVDSDSMRRALKMVFLHSRPAMQKTSLISEACETSRDKAAAPIEGLETDVSDLATTETDDALELRAAKGACDDLLHEIVRDRGWAYCPACGAEIG